MPTIYSKFEEYDEEGVLLAYLNKHYRNAFLTDREVEFLKKPATPEREARAMQIKSRVMTRMLRNIDRIRIARCPKCQRILETPRALQCLWCKHKFHHMPRPPSQVSHTLEVHTETENAEDGEEGDQPLIIKKIRVRSELIDHEQEDSSREEEPDDPENMT